MINQKLEEIISKYKISKTNNIIYGTNIPMPNLVIPTPWKTYMRFDASEFYFFYFDTEGITIYPLNKEEYAIIPWKEIIDFKISHFLIIGKMTIKTPTATLKFQINRTVIGCPWIKTNTKYLEENNYFYPKKNK